MDLKDDDPDRNNLVIPDTRPNMFFFIPYDLAILFGVLFFGVDTQFHTWKYGFCVVPFWIGAALLVRRDVNGVRVFMTRLRLAMTMLDTYRWGGQSATPWMLKGRKANRYALDAGLNTDPLHRPLLFMETDGSEFVPDVGHISPELVLLAGGELLAMIRAPGFPELASMRSRNIRRRQLNDLFRGISDDNVTLSVHLVHHAHVPPFPLGQFRSRFARRLMEKYRGELPGWACGQRLVRDHRRLTALLSYQDAAAPSLVWWPTEARNVGFGRDDPADQQHHGKPDVIPRGIRQP